LYAAGFAPNPVEGNEQMRTTTKIVCLAAAAALMLGATGCDKLRARDQLNKGVASFKNLRYEQATEHFKNAVALDPNLQNAKLYLAAAYFAQYIPGVESPDNLQNANLAIEQYNSVLAKDPNNVNSIKGIAILDLQMKKFDEAKQYYRKAVELDPNDPEAYYSVGVIDWTQAYQPRVEARNKLGLRPDETLKDKKVCVQLREKDGPVIQEGLDNLNKAIQLRPDYDDAMAYINLLYREKSERECDMPEQAAADLKAANEWSDKVMEVRKVRAEKQQNKSTGITLDQPK
jgi:tetratricopeptide (TPR) repeat protein